MLLWLLIIGLLAWVAWEDFKYREVLVLLFPILAAVVILHAVLLGVFSITSVAINLFVLGIQLGLLNLLVYRRTKKWLMHGGRWIGWGDVAFFLVLAFCFSTVNFVVFQLVSLVIILFSTIACIAFGRVVVQIPLAGGQALILAILYLTDHGQLGARLFVDIPIMQLIR